MKTADKILATIEEIPTLPTIYNALSDLMVNPRATIEMAANVIGADQAATFKILRVANSSLFGFHGRVDTITQAILRLGFNEIRHIIFTLSVINFFSKTRKFIAFRPSDLWAHSIGVGIASRIIAKKIGAVNIENYFIAGILHDIGKILLFEISAKEYIKAIRLAEERGVSIATTEKEIFGINHMEAGGLFARKWNLPEQVVIAVKHHDTGIVDNSADMICSTIHLANIYVRMLNLGFPGDNLIPEPNMNAVKSLRLPKDVFNEIEPELLQNYNETVQMLLY